MPSLVSTTPYSRAWTPVNRKLTLSPACPSQLVVPS